jgi:hypothetical protein
MKQDTRNEPLPRSTPKYPQIPHPPTATSPPADHPAGSGRRVGDGAVGQHQAAVEVALGGGRQAAVEFLAQQARLLARLFGGEQNVRQFGVAQQQAPVRR